MGPLPQAQVRTRSGRSETARCTRIAPQSWPTRSTGAPARSISRTSQSTYASLVASKPAARAHPKPGSGGAMTSARRRRARSGAHRRCVSGTPWTRKAGTKASLARRRTLTPPGASGLEELPPPPRPRPHEELALVQAVLPVRPELDRLGDDAEARPRRRPRHRPPAVAPPQLNPALDERAAARERGALLRGERGQLARPRPCGPVRVGLRRRDLLDAPFDAHLPPEAIPVEGDGRARARAELAALAAAAVGEEDEAAAVGGLQEDEADRGRAPTPGGGERHRLGERDTGARGGPEPAAEARERLGQGTYSTPQEKTRAGVTSTITTSDSSSAASSGYCGYFA